MNLNRMVLDRESYELGFEDALDCCQKVYALVQTFLFNLPIVIGGEMSEYLGKYRFEIFDSLRARLRRNPPDDALTINNYSKFDAAVGAELMDIKNCLDRQ